ATLEATGDYRMPRIVENPCLYGERPGSGPTLYVHNRNRGATATETPTLLPDALINAALDAAQRVTLTEGLAARFLGQWLTEPSPAAWFEPQENAPDFHAGLPKQGFLILDRCTRMMYRGKELYINGELADIGPGAALRALAND